MKQFIVTSIDTEPDGTIFLNGPEGSLRIKRHECDDPGHEHSFSHVLLSTGFKATTYSKIHRIEVATIQPERGIVF